MKRSVLRLFTPMAALAVMLAGCGGGGNHVADANRYRVTNLVANTVVYHPQIINPNLWNAWGIGQGPGGTGAHWWVSTNGSGKSIEYVGDVNGSPFTQDSFSSIDIPGTGGDHGAPTGMVANPGSGFVITQAHPNGTINAPAKFLWASDQGIVTAWTERVNPDGSHDRPSEAVTVWDQSGAGAAYFGIAMSPSGDRIYLADFGANPGIVVLDSQFHNISAGRFSLPFPGYEPFNVQTIGNSVFVAYVKPEDVAEELHGIGLGRLAEFDTNGNLIAAWDDRSLLNAPWGIVKAPAGFGIYSGKLLVGNFGSGAITVFDPSTRKAVDYLRGTDGNPIQIDGLWALVVGNGVDLGDANTVYFSAGPNDEQDGIFGKIRL
jgi:uncharacterized protein (TIGR03118 family)